MKVLILKNREEMMEMLNLKQNEFIMDQIHDEVNIEDEITLTPLT